jgi:hypothetical protein
MVGIVFIEMLLYKLPAIAGLTTIVSSAFSVGQWLNPPRHRVGALP